MDAASTQGVGLRGPAAAEAEEVQGATAKAVCERLGFELDEVEPAVGLEQLRLADPREPMPTQARRLQRRGRPARGRPTPWGSPDATSSGPSIGRSNVPQSFVARPRDEIELEAVLEWCIRPRAWRRSPTGEDTCRGRGRPPAVGDRCDGALSVDLGELDAVVEVDEVSCLALIEAGALGPSLERTVTQSTTLTLRHFPPWFEYFRSRRIDRDPRRRAVGDALDGRRGPGGSIQRDHPDGRMGGSAQAAGLRRRDQPRSDGRGLGGRAGGHHPGAWVQRRQRRPRHRQLSGGSTSQATPMGRRPYGRSSRRVCILCNCGLLDGGNSSLMIGTTKQASSLLVLRSESLDSPVDDAMARALAVCAEHSSRTAAVDAHPSSGRGAAEDGGRGRRHSGGGRPGWPAGGSRSWRCPTCGT